MSVQPGVLRVSDNGRFLLRQDGTPFFWLGDTAWELFHRLDREEADHYLRHRAKQEFSVILAVVLAELDGLHEANAYGDLALIDNDPGRPNDAFFRHVDWVVDRAGELGLIIGMLPTWGKYLFDRSEAIFDHTRARVYGEYLGWRYGGKDVVWILGGGRPATGVEGMWRAMAEGLHAGSQRQPLITYHPPGWMPGDGPLGNGHSSSEFLHGAGWLDMHMIQSGHARLNQPNYLLVARDYDLYPIKPTLDGEPNHEDHPINWKPQDGRFNDYDVRKAAYWAVFAGACGHTYGCHDVWQFYIPGRQAIASAHIPWQEALHLPGAQQMRHLRRLIESRPFLERIPEQDLILARIGAAADHVRCTRDGTPWGHDATFMMAYVPRARPLRVDTSVIHGRRLRAWWYDPQSGQSIFIAEIANVGMCEVNPPLEGPDWVLVLDDAAVDYAPPGSCPSQKGSVSVSGNK